MSCLNTAPCHAPDSQATTSNSRRRSGGPPTATALGGRFWTGALRSGSTDDLDFAAALPASVRAANFFRHLPSVSQGCLAVHMPPATPAHAIAALLAPPTSWEELDAKYAGLAAVASTFHQEAIAAVCEMVLQDVMAVRDAAANELLSLEQASQESGYHVDHLRRMIRDRKIASTRDRSHPLIRRRDLPIKGSATRSNSSKGGYDAAADATAIITSFGARRASKTKAGR